MFFKGVLEIDPSQITVLKRVKPSKFFAKLKDVLSFGALTEKQEQETFTAVSILQQINIAMRTVNIKNIIRLSVDDYDFYLDEKGEEDDLEQAMFEFKAKVDPIESELFDAIYLILEHEQDSIKYLIEIQIKRKHKVGEYPIFINVNGVISDFKSSQIDSDDSLKQRMKSKFADQKSYDEYIIRMRASFNQFLAILEQALRRFIKVDDIKFVSSANIIRPKNRVKSASHLKGVQDTEPIFYGYYGFSDYFFYSWLWSDLLYDNNIFINYANVVDSSGSDIMTIGEQGFNAGESNTFNLDNDFEPPIAGDITYFGDNEYSETLENANLVIESTDEQIYEDVSTEDSSWLDDGVSWEDSSSDIDTDTDW